MINAGSLRVEGLVTRHVGPIDLEVAPGQCLCLTGASGCGKTLLLRAIADLDPHQGRVYLGDTECMQLSGHEWRRRVGLLPAETRWWHERVGEHFPDTGVDPRWFAELDLAPEILAREVARLSGGERQRLGLLRLLCRHPQALLLDEPTASLDPGNTARVERLVRSYAEARRIPVIWVSHSRGQVERVASRHYVLAAGRLVARPAAPREAAASQRPGG